MAKIKGGKGQERIWQIVFWAVLISAIAGILTAMVFWIIDIADDTKNIIEGRETTTEEESTNTSELIELDFNYTGTEPGIAVGAVDVLYLSTSTIWAEGEDIISAPAWPVENHLSEEIVFWTDNSEVLFPPIRRQIGNQKLQSGRTHFTIQRDRSFSFMTETLIPPDCLPKEWDGGAEFIDPDSGLAREILPGYSILNPGFLGDYMISSNKEEDVGKRFLLALGNGELITAICRRYDPEPPTPIYAIEYVYSIEEEE